MRIKVAAFILINIFCLTSWVWCKYTHQYSNNLIFMNEFEYYNRSERTDSLYDKINEELEKYYQIRFNEIALEYEIIDKLTNKRIEFNESSILIHLHREKLNVSPQVFKTYRSEEHTSELQSSE